MEKARSSIGDYRQKTSAILPSPHYRNSNRTHDEANIAQTRNLGRLVKWAIELSEFDFRYKPRTTVKGKILAYFIMEFTSAEPTETA